MRSPYLLLLIFYSASTLACGDISVPIQSKVSKDSDGLIYVSIKAPIDYEALFLMGAEYNNGENQVPMYKGYQEKENLVSYEISGDMAFFQNSVIRINYGIRNTLCAHSENLSWERLVKSCKNCN